MTLAMLPIAEGSDKSPSRKMISYVMESRYQCYIVGHSNGRSTYVGYTVDLQRRLRQHNGELVGGAKATTRLLKDGAWRFIATITSPAWDARRAMQCEWSIKYPTRQRPCPAKFRTPQGRIQSLPLVFEHIPEPAVLAVHPDYMSFLPDVPSHVQVVTLD